MEFAIEKNNRKVFKYASQITQLAHRDQVSMYVDLDDLEEYDSELCQKVLENSKRYIAFLYEIVQGLLPEYKTREVTAKDSLGKLLFEQNWDIFIKYLVMKLNFYRHLHRTSIDDGGKIKGTTK